MLQELRPATTLVILFTILTGIIHPFAMTGRGDLSTPGQRQPGDAQWHGGLELMGQNFTGSRYFHDRPSAISRYPYNAANSAGSNLGPTSKALITRIQGDVEKLRNENPSAKIPTDLVTASGSGLDPEAAFWQVPRIAKERNLPDERVRQLVLQHIEGRLLGLSGEPRVNVLRLNLALDQSAGN